MTGGGFCPSEVTGREECELGSTALYGLCTEEKLPPPLIDADEEKLPLSAPGSCGTDVRMTGWGVANPRAVGSAPGDIDECWPDEVGRRKEAKREEVGDAESSA